MEKVVEDYFSESQADMVSIALDYVDGRADADGTSAFGAFY